MSSANTPGTLHIVCTRCHRTNRIPEARLEDGPRCGQCKSPLFQGDVVELTNESFARHIRGDLPVLVDFWAPWCGPCQSFAPVFKQAAGAMEPFVRCAKVDTDALPQVAQPYHIRSIPTLVLFRQGRELARISGALPLAQLQQWVRNQLG